MRRDLNGELDEKRQIFKAMLKPLIEEYLGDDPSLNDYEAVVSALEETYEEWNMIENGLVELADSRGLDGEDFSLTKSRIDRAAGVSRP